MSDQGSTQTAPLPNAAQAGRDPLPKSLHEGKVVSLEGALFKVKHIKTESGKIMLKMLNRSEAEVHRRR